MVGAAVVAVVESAVMVDAAAVLETSVDMRLSCLPVCCRMMTHMCGRRPPCVSPSCMTSMPSWWRTEASSTLSRWAAVADAALTLVTGCNDLPTEGRLAADRAIASAAVKHMCGSSCCCALLTAHNAVVCGGQAT